MKIFTLAVATLITAFAAQGQISDIPATNMIKDFEPQMAESSEWYNYARMIGDNSSSAPYYRNFLFPDTTVQVIGSNGPFNVWLHSLGQTFDPTSENWELSGNTMLSDFHTYSLDSIALPYRYNRPQTDNADTLIIQVYLHDKHTFNTFSSTGQTYATIQYDYQNRIGLNADTTITYLLTDDDSVTTSQGVIDLPIGLTIGNNEVVSVTYTYLPGNPYNVNDTIDFYAGGVTNEINGFLVYNFYDEDKLTEPGVYNQALMVTPDIRYNQSSNGWNGYYIPGYAYNSGFYHNDLFYKISSLNTGVEEQEVNNQKLYPSIIRSGSSFTISDYNGIVQLYDMTGKLIQTIQTQNGKVTPTPLNSGLYFVHYNGQTSKIIIE